MRVSDLFTYAKKRQDIFLARQAGQPKPWTRDLILRQYKFCNVFREDDATTVYIREKWRCDGADAIFRLSVARCINRIESLRRIEVHPAIENPKFWEIFHALLRSAQPLVTGAYIVKTPAGMDKLDGVIEILRPIREDALSMRAAWLSWTSNLPDTLEGMHQFLTGYSCIGGFMAYEIVSDLRYTDLLRSAPDVNTWAFLGPGATRGMCRLLNLPLDALSRNSKKDQLFMLTCMQQILAASKDPVNWPRGWPPWEMREVEHGLCEFDKYERTRLGEGRPKQLYPGG